MVGEQVDGNCVAVLVGVCFSICSVPRHLRDSLIHHNIEKHPDTVHNPFVENLKIRLSIPRPSLEINNKYIFPPIIKTRPNPVLNINSSGIILWRDVNR